MLTSVCGGGVWSRRRKITRIVRHRMRRASSSCAPWRAWSLFATGAWPSPDCARLCVFVHVQPAVSPRTCLRSCVRGYLCVPVSCVVSANLLCSVVWMFPLYTVSCWRAMWARACWAPARSPSSSLSSGTTLPSSAPSACTPLVSLALLACVCVCCCVCVCATSWGKVLGCFTSFLPLIVSLSLVF